MKVYKYKNKLCSYLPYNVTSALDIKEGDELEFIAFNTTAFLVSKKSDILNMIMKSDATSQSDVKPSLASSKGPSEMEIQVLKKIDTLRYNDRTRENVAKLLNAQEKEVLLQMVKKDYLKPFKSKQGIEVYSISKNIYDNFLMRKMAVNDQKQKDAFKEMQKEVQSYTVRSKDPNDEYIKALSKNGFVVLLSESEASRVSMLLEQSIRHGEILGTRAFNKKFYIVLRDYLNQYAPGVVKELKAGPAKAEDIAKKVKQDADGVKAILYLLAESGEIMEKKKDLFTIA